MIRRPKGPTASRERRPEPEYPDGFLDPLLPKGRLSASAVSTFLKCPKMFEFRYVEGLKEPPAFALVEGKAHHAWLERDNRLRIAKPDAVITVSDAMEQFRAELKAESDGVDLKHGEDHEESLDRARGMIRSYVQSVRGRLSPAAAEEEVVHKVGGVPTIGYIDLVDRRGVIVDYKVSSKRKTEDDVRWSLQLTSYADAKKAPITAMVSFNKKDETVTMASVRVSRGMVAWTRQTFRSVSDSIQTGVFPPCSIDSWWCSKKFCGYWHRCRGSFEV